MSSDERVGPASMDAVLVSIGEDEYDDGAKRIAERALHVLAWPLAAPPTGFVEVSRN